MISKTEFFGRPRSLAKVMLCGMSMLAACGKPDATQVPPVVAKSANSPCLVAHTYVVGALSKKNEELFSASAAGDIHRVEQAIVDGANVNAAGSLRRSPLFASAFCNRPEVARLLMDKGSQANAKDANGMSPLHAAVIVGGIDAARVLIEKGADIKIRDSAGHTPLHSAAATDQVLMVQMLLENGADAVVRDKNGMTAASLALDNGHKAPAEAIKAWQAKIRKPR